MSVKKLLGVVLCAGWMLSAGATAAAAGEITGNGKSLKNPDGTLNGASVCAFSGLNDTYSGDPTVPDADGFFRTQNWGQIPQAVRAILATMGLHPGQACNPTIGEPGA